MPLLDSGEIDNALVNLLSADAELLTLVPDGVYFDEAPQGKQNFTLVSLVEGIVRPVMGPATDRRGTPTEPAEGAGPPRSTPAKGRTEFQRVPE